MIILQVGVEITTNTNLVDIVPEVLDVMVLKKSVLHVYLEQMTVEEELQSLEAVIASPEIVTARPAEIEEENMIQDVPGETLIPPEALLPLVSADEAQVAKSRTIEI